MKIFILNDTSQTGHAGCQLVMRNYQRLCKENDIKILGTVPCCVPLELYYDKFKKADFLLVNGEGSIHDNNRNELLHIANKFPAVLMNTVFQNNVKPEALKKFKLIRARESLSAKELDCEVVPPIVFAYSDELKPVPITKPGITTIDSAVSPGKNGNISIEQSIESFLADLAPCAAICTGRFHGACLCMALNIPFSCYSSNTWKNQGLMLDAGLQDYYRETFDEAYYLTPQTIHPNAVYYKARAHNAVQQFFALLRQGDFL